jgi:hypothetical protein
MNGTKPAWSCAPGVRTQELSYLKLLAVLTPRAQLDHSGRHSWEQIYKD